MSSKAPNPDKIFRCSSAIECERASTCLFGKPRNSYDPYSGICHDIKPYVAGGKRIWDEEIAA